MPLPALDDPSAVALIVLEILRTGIVDDVAEDGSIQQVVGLRVDGYSTFETLLYRCIELDIAGFPDVIVHPVGYLAQPAAGVAAGDLGLHPCLGELEEERQIGHVGSLTVQGTGLLSW